MSIDQDASGPGLGPQTPAARRARTPREPLSPEERERLREESRARRRARAAAAGVVAPEPPEASPPVAPESPEPAPPTAPEPEAAEITVRRLPDEEREEPAPTEHVRSTPARERPPAAPRERPAAPAAPPSRPAPAGTGERIAVVLGLASAFGIAAFLGSTIGSGSLPFAGGGLEARPSARAVAPGGWIEVTGEGAPANGKVVLESRSGDGRWRRAGDASADGDGEFRVRARVLERPGRVMVRASVPGVATAAPAAVTVRPLRLASVGDINLGDVPGASIAANGPRYPWESTGGALRSADLAFGNLECAISTRGAPVPKQFTFRGTPEALAGLRRHAGMDVLNLANNHVGDYGPDATLDTVRHVERLGMKAVGAGTNLRRALAPQVVERLGLRVAFVGFSEIAPLEFAATDGRPGTAWARPEWITAAVRAARRQADVVVATFHWGIEKQTLETAQQRALADVAVAAGAQVVIGAHPHTLQPVRRQGGALVAYSLGNFVFGAASEETTSSGILVLDLAAEGVTGARWRPARIAGGRPVLDQIKPWRLPLRDAFRMETGVQL